MRHLIVFMTTILIAQLADAQTFRRGAGFTPITAPLRSNFRAIGPGDKMITIADLDSTFVKRVSVDASNNLVLVYQGADNMEGTLTFTPTGGGGSGGGGGLSTAQVQALVGTMFTTNVEAGGIALTYDATTQKINASIPDELLTETEVEDFAKVGNNAQIPTPRIADDAVSLPKLSATGTPGATNFLRGDDSWAEPSAIRHTITFESTTAKSPNNLYGDGAANNARLGYLRTSPSHYVVLRPDAYGVGNSIAGYRSLPGGDQSGAITPVVPSGLFILQSTASLIQLWVSTSEALWHRNGVIANAVILYVTEEGQASTTEYDLTDHMPQGSLRGFYRNISVRAFEPGRRYRIEFRLGGNVNRVTPHSGNHIAELLDFDDLDMIKTEIAQMTAGAGDITGVVAGTGLTGGGTQGDVTIAIADDGVGPDQVADDAVGIPQLSATGSPGSTTFLRGDNTWSAPPATGSGGLDESGVDARIAVQVERFARTGTSDLVTLTKTQSDIRHQATLPTAAAATFDRFYGQGATRTEKVAFKRTADTNTLVMRSAYLGNEISGWSSAAISPWRAGGHLSPSAPTGFIALVAEDVSSVQDLVKFEVSTTEGVFASQATSVTLAWRQKGSTDAYSNLTLSNVSTPRTNVRRFESEEDHAFSASNPFREGRDYEVQFMQPGTTGPVTLHAGQHLVDIVDSDIIETFRGEVKADIRQYIQDDPDDQIPSSILDLTDTPTTLIPRRIWRTNAAGTAVEQVAETDQQDEITHVAKIPTNITAASPDLVFLSHDYTEGVKSDAIVTVGFADPYVGYSDGHLVLRIGDISKLSPLNQLIGEGNATNYFIESVYSFNTEWLDQFDRITMNGTEYTLGVRFLEFGIHVRRINNYPTQQTAAQISLNFRRPDDSYYWTDAASLRHKAGLYEKVDGAYSRLTSKGFVHFDGVGPPTSPPTAAAQSYVDNDGRLWVSGDQTTHNTTTPQITDSNFTNAFYNTTAGSPADLTDGQFTWTGSNYFLQRQGPTSHAGATWNEIWTYIANISPSNSHNNLRDNTDFLGPYDTREAAADARQRESDNSKVYYYVLNGIPGQIKRIDTFTPGATLIVDHFFWRGPFLVSADVITLIGQHPTEFGDITIPDDGIIGRMIADDAVGIPQLSATGNPSAATFLRGDNAWVAPVGENDILEVTALPAATSIASTDRDKLYIVRDHDTAAIQTVAHLKPTVSTATEMTAGRSTIYTGFSSVEATPFGHMDEPLNITGIGEYQADPNSNDRHFYLSVAATGTIPRNNDDKSIYIREAGTEDDYWAITVSNGISGSYLSAVYNRTNAILTAGKRYEIVIRAASAGVNAPNFVSGPSPSDRYFFYPGGFKWVVLPDADELNHSNISIEVLEDHVVVSRVGPDDLEDNAVTNPKVADDAIGIPELSASGTPSATTYLRGDNTWATPAGGSGSGGASSFSQLSGTIADNQIPDDRVTNRMMANGAIGLAELNTTGTPTSTSYLRGDLTWATPAGGGGGGGPIAASQIPDDLIINRMVADDAVGLAELSATGTPSPTNFLRGDNTWDILTLGGLSGFLTDGQVPDMRITERMLDQTIRNQIGGASGVTTDEQTILEELTLRFPADATFQSQLFGDQCGWTNIIQNYGSPPPNRPSGLRAIWWSNNITQSNIYRRVYIYVTESATGRSYDGKRIRLNGHTLTLEFLNNEGAENRYRSTTTLGNPPGAPCPTDPVHGREDWTFNLEDIAEEINDFLPGVAWYYHATSHTAGGSTGGTINTNDLEDGAVTEPKLADRSVTEIKVADDAVGVPQLSATGTPSANTFLRGDNSWAIVPAGASSFGSLSGTIADNQIPDDRITQRMIADQAVGTGQVSASILGQLQNGYRGQWLSVIDYPVGATVQNNNVLWEAYGDPARGHEPSEQSPSWHRISNSVSWRGSAGTIWNLGDIYENSSDQVFLLTTATTAVPPPSVGWIQISANTIVPNPIGTAGIDLPRIQIGQNNYNITVPDGAITMAKLSQAIRDALTETVTVKQTTEATPQDTVSFFHVQNDVDLDDTNFVFSDADIAAHRWEFNTIVSGTQFTATIRPAQFTALRESQPGQPLVSETSISAINTINTDLASHGYAIMRAGADSFNGTDVRIWYARDDDNSLLIRVRPGFNSQSDNTNYIRSYTFVNILN